MNDRRPLTQRVQQLEQVYRRIQAERFAGMAGLLHPKLSVAAVDFEPDSQTPGLALGVLITPWFMNLVRLPLNAAAAAELPAPGAAQDHALAGWTLRFLGQHEPGLGRYAAASLVSPMAEFADQAAALATAQALLERLRPRPARRGFLFGGARAARAA